MVGVNEVGIRYKDNVLVRGDLKVALNSFLRKERSKITDGYIYVVHFNERIFRMLPKIGTTVCGTACTVV